jgi:hypothetical protein
MTPPDPSDANTFKKSVYATTGNLVARDVYVSMGHALSQWEHAEVLIATMFSILVNPTGRGHVAFRAIGNLFASGNRRELILGAAEAYFAILDDGKDAEIHKRADDLQQSIRKHMNLIGDASRRRDEIAHGVVMGEEFNTTTTEWTYYLVPAFYASKKKEVLPPFKPSYRFGTKELDRFSELFGAVHNRTGEINRQISEFYQSLPETIRERHL